MASKRHLAILLSLVWCASCQHDAKTRTADPNEDAFANVSTEELFQKGVAYARRGDLVRAEQYVGAAKERGYAESESVPWLVRISLASAHYNSALGYAEPYLKKHPGDWSLRFLVASIHDALGHSDRAKREMERVLLEAPAEPLPHYRYAILLLERFQDPVAARPHFDRYLKLAPSGEHAEEVRFLIEHPESLAPSEGPPRIEALGNMQLLIEEAK